MNLKHFLIYLVIIVVFAYNWNMKSSRDYTGVILEEIRDQVKAVFEAVGQIQDTIKTLATQKNLDRVEKKVDTIQIALTDTNKELREHDVRINHLEQLVN